MSDISECIINKGRVFWPTRQQALMNKERTSRGWVARWYDKTNGSFHEYRS